MAPAPAYEPLPVACDLVAASLAWAVEKLNPEVSCDLHVSLELAPRAREILSRLPDDYIVNRIRVNKYYRMAPQEWFVECGDGRSVGANPA